LFFLIVDENNKMAQWLKIVVLLSVIGWVPGIPEVPVTDNAMSSIEEKRALLTVGSRKKTTLLEPVLFEPINRMRLSLSTFQVQSYIDFNTYFEAFDNLERYMLDFKVNLGTLIDPSHNIQSDLDVLYEVGNEPMEYMQEQLRESYGELVYQLDVFYKVRDDLYESIDHLREHPGMADDDSGGSFATTAAPPQGKPFQRSDLNIPDDEEAQHRDRVKRSFFGHVFGAIGDLFGFGGSDDSYDKATIDQIKGNLKILQDNTNLQQDQILEQYALINLTRLEVGNHRVLLHTLDMEFLQMNNTMYQLQNVLAKTRYTNLAMQDIRSKQTRILTALIGLQQDKDKIKQYLQAIATHTVTPTLIYPPDIRIILAQAKDAMRTHARLTLPSDPDTHIWDYYELLRVYPVVIGDILVVLLEIPLVDKSLVMNLYRVHNLPMLHPEMKVAFTYQLEGEYLAISTSGEYVTMPLALDVALCKATKGHVCRLTTALYPTDKIKWCTFALFINDRDMIDQVCVIETKAQYSNLALSLGGNLWAVSALSTDKLQIRCLVSTDYFIVRPPMTFLTLPDGCEAYSINIFIPARSSLTLISKTLANMRLFVGFNQTYINITAYGLADRLNLTRLSSEKLEELSHKLPTYGPLPVTHLKERIKMIDEDYPKAFPQWLTLLLAILGCFFGTLKVIFIVWCCYRCQIRKAKARATVISTGDIKKDLSKDVKPILPAKTSFLSGFWPNKKATSSPTVRYSATPNAEKVDLDLPRGSTTTGPTRSQKQYHDTPTKDELWLAKQDLEKKGMRFKKLDHKLARKHRHQTSLDYIEESAD
jgi:hypothetical protein